MLFMETTYLNLVFIIFLECSLEGLMIYVCSGEKVIIIIVQVILILSLCYVLYYLYIVEQC